MQIGFVGRVVAREYRLEAYVTARRQRGRGAIPFTESIAAAQTTEYQL